MTPFGLPLGSPIFYVLGGDIMAKRKREITEAKIERFIKEGRGQGTGKEYLPWLRIQDVPSEGRATRGVGWTTGRRHELLSDNERDYCYLLDYSDDVSDIREQFPLLPLEETLLIAHAKFNYDREYRK